MSILKSLKKKSSYTNWKQMKTKVNNRQTVISIMENGPKRYKEIKEKVEFSDTTLSKIISELHDQGLIQPVIVKGKYPGYCITKNVKSEAKNLKSKISGLEGAFQEQFQIQRAYAEYIETGSILGLKKIDPVMLEFLQDWTAMQISGNLPSVFLTPKEKIPQKILQLVKDNKRFLR